MNSKARCLAIDHVRSVGELSLLGRMSPDDTFDVDCEYCGQFTITQEALRHLWHTEDSDLPLLRFLSAHTRQAAGRNERIIVTTSRGVLQGLLSGTLCRLAGAAPERVAPLTARIFQRINDGPGAKRVREHCLEIFTGLYVWQDEELCRQLVCSVVDSTSERPGEAGHIPFQLREPLTVGASPSTEERDTGIRRRAIDLMLSILRAARAGLKSLENKHPGELFRNWPTGEQERAKSLAELVDQIGREVYFASGSFKGGNADERSELTQKQRERFYRETADLLDELAASGFARVAHHLVETLESYVPLDAEGVLLRIAQVVKASEAYGYQFESLAVDLVVRIVERYLAEYRHVLRTNEACRLAIVDVLDIFVRAGWPATRQLAFRLDDIFR